MFPSGIRGSGTAEAHRNTRRAAVGSPGIGDGRRIGCPAVVFAIARSVPDGKGIGTAAIRGLHLTGHRVQVGEILRPSTTPNHLGGSDQRIIADVGDGYGAFLSVSAAYTELLVGIVPGGGTDAERRPGTACIAHHQEAARGEGHTQPPKSGVVCTMSHVRYSSALMSSPHYPSPLRQRSAHRSRMKIRSLHVFAPSGCVGRC